MDLPFKGWTKTAWWPAFRISGVYAVVAFLWIYTSDAVLGAIFRDPAQITRLSTLKGTFFVCVTALMLFLDRHAGETAFRRQQRSTEESEAKFRSLIENAPVGIVVTDASGRITECNTATSDITGFSPEELTGGEIWPLAAPGTEEELHADFRRLKTVGHIHTEMDSVGKDGRRMSLAISAAQVRPDLFIGFVRDVTEQREAALARRAAEEATRAASAERLAMLEAASLARVVPWSMNASGWMQWGESLASVFTWPEGPRRRHQGWPWERIHPEDHLRLRIALAQADRGFVHSFECRMTQREDSWIWTRWTLAADNGQYHGAVQDIHEQHEVQAQLLQTQKLESMGTLVGGITHDFNNLLMAILGFSELMLQDDDLTKAQRKGMDTIYRAASRGRTLINQFLGFSRKLPTRRVQANLNGLLEEASRLLQHAVSNRVDLRLELAPDLPDAHFDPGQLHQVVMNLALNARDAIQDHGTITLRTSLAEVGPELAAAHDRPQGTYLVLEVEDDGMGIPPEAIQRIFEPFFTTKGAKGTGLGLSMVHGIVMEHGGIVECRSSVGRGTSMRVCLPLMATGDVPHLSEGGLIRMPGILALSPDPALLERVTGALGMLGQSGRSTSSPEEALELVGAGDLQVLLLDPDALPGQGLAFLRSLEERAWHGWVVSMGSRLDPAFLPRILGHLSPAFSLFDLVEILDRTPLDEPIHAAHSPS